MPLIISTSEWPIVHYTIERTTNDEAEIQAYIADISGVLSRQQPYSNTRSFVFRGAKISRFAAVSSRASQSQPTTKRLLSA